MRIKCPVCGKRVKMRRDGKPYAHQYSGVPCHGIYVETKTMTLSPIERAEKLVAELVEVAAKYHSGAQHKNWQIWAINAIANELARAGETDGELHS